MSNQLNFFLDRLTAFVDLEMERGQKCSVLTSIRLLELFQKKDTNLVWMKLLQCNRCTIRYSRH